MAIRPLPDHLLYGAHRREELARHGVTDHALRGDHWTRTNQGLWAWGPRGSAGQDGWSRVRRAAPLVADRGAIGGWAAALAHGATDFDGMTADGEPLPVPVCLPRAVQCRRRHDVRVFRSDLAPDEVVLVDSVRVTSPVRTAADLARRAGNDTEGVVALDALLRLDATLVTSVRGWIEAHPRRRGLPRARRVVELARPGSASVQESRLRMLWVLDAGLPTPLVNQWLYTADGRLLGCADLFDPQAALVGEYDGGYHADARRRSRDHGRREGFEACGLTVVQHTATDLTEGRDRAVDRLCRAHAAGLARARCHDRWRAGDPPSWA